ncbi:hypothetical protein BDA99DRAFT_562538 [Phascolomyces articulosus]|uniref:Uncharacterized protein n=1 Tax=Phascolomyces articulosus TaxID=60185 RepID=A0AAD5JUU7_9FUNG|nr:hypothetical protein BDA99DRAFT_562538 [Phascolomyces articulosus]
MPKTSSKKQKTYVYNHNPQTDVEEIKGRYDKLGRLYNTKTKRNSASLEPTTNDEGGSGSSAIAKRSRLENSSFSEVNNSEDVDDPSDDYEYVGNIIMDPPNDNSESRNYQENINVSRANDSNRNKKTYQQRQEEVEKGWSDELSGMASALISSYREDGGPNLKETFPYIGGKCKEKNYETLIHHHLFPSSPSKPIIAFHISLLEFYECLNVEGQLPILAFANACADMNRFEPFESMAEPPMYMNTEPNIEAVQLQSQTQQHYQSPEPHSQISLPSSESATFNTTELVSALLKPENEVSFLIPLVSAREKHNAGRIPIADTVKETVGYPRIDNRLATESIKSLL